uniref:Cytoskeleton associated protein 2 like n=1 Tax=Xenopus tropicalis TaxID=8364 RepID=A0A6I8Q9N5_XENTR
MTMRGSENADWLVRKGRLSLRAKQGAGGTDMEKQKSLNAVDERRRQLQEYLAAKGKLKPLTNTKPYLKDCTNSQKPSCRPKLPVVCKRGKNVTNAKAVSQENKPRAPSHFFVQQRSSSAQPRVHNRATVSVTAKPRNASGINNNPLQEREPDTQTDNINVSCFGPNQTTQETGQEKAASCAQGCVNNGAEPNGRRDLGSEAEGQENGIDCEKIKEDVFHEGEVAGDKQIETQQLQGVINNTDVGPTAGTCDMSVKLQESTTRIHHPTVIHKTAPCGSVTQRPLGKTLYCTRKTHLYSKAKQPVSHCRNSAVQHGLRRSLTSRASVSQNSAICLKQKQDVKSQNMPTASVVTKNEKPMHSGLKQATCKYGASSAMPNGQQQPKHVKDIVSSTAFSRVQSSGHQTAEFSACSTKPPQHQDRDIATSNNPNVKQQNRAMADTSTEYRKPVEKTKELTAASSMNAQLGVNSNGINGQHGTPHMATEDRKKKLEEWLSSKGKTYKRPPMILPTKKPMKRKTTATCSQWDGIEEEEDIIFLSKKINGTLNECLELIDKGAASEAVNAILSMVPKAEKFAKFWVCKAKLLEREGTFDVVGLYEQAVQSGAKPIAELRELIFELMRNTSKKRKDEPLQSQNPVSGYLSSPASPVWNAVKSLRMPCAERCRSCQGSAVKFQVATLSSKKEGGPEWKTLTPVRRSLRINQATSRRSFVLQEHNTVVASLGELLEMADTECFLYAGNEAFPEKTHMDILDMIKQSTTNKPEGGPS